MKKKVLIVFGGLGVLLLGGGFGGQAWLKGRLKKESLVAQMEVAWNCRAHLDETKVSLFSSPASVTLVGLKLAPRDEEVLKPLAERAALMAEATQLAAQEVVLSIELKDLVQGTLFVDRLHIEGLNIRNVVDEEGKGSLAALFKSPKAAEASGEGTPSVSGGGGGEAAPASKEITPELASEAPDQGAEKGKKKKAPGPTRVLVNASDMRVNLAAKSAGVSNGRFESIDLKGGTRTMIEDFDFKLTDIDVAPGDLANHNQCKFEISASVTVEKTEPKTPIVNVMLSADGTVAPFNPQTGEWNPDMDLNLMLRKGGVVGGAPLSKQLGKKEQERLQEYGVELGDVAIGGTLQEDAATRVHMLPSGKMIVKQDTAFIFPDYQMLLAEKSWFSPAQDAHIARATLTISPELSARILQDSRKTLTEKFGETLAVIGLKTVEVMMMDEKKERIVIPFRAKGPMSKPAVNLDNVLGDIADLLKDAGKSFLDGLFSKEEDKKPKEEKPKEEKPEPEARPQAEAKKEP